MRETRARMNFMGTKKGTKQHRKKKHQRIDRTSNNFDRKTKSITILKPSYRLQSRLFGLHIDVSSSLIEQDLIELCGFKVKGTK